MQDKLIIRLKNNADATTAIQWLHWDILNKSPLNQGEGAGEELINIAKQVQEILVLVPGVDILLTEVKLPKMSSAQLLKAIPFALEEQISEDAALLHFAAGHAPKGQPIPVAVINKEKLSAWQNFLKEQLKEAYSKVVAFIPDTLAIPFQEDMYSIVVDGTQVIVRSARETGFVMEKEDLIPVLQLMLNQPQRPKPTVINLYDAEGLLAEEVKKLGIPVNVLTENVQPLGLMAQNISVQKHVLNLLQGAYAQPKNKISLQKLVKFSFALAASWLILLTLANLVSLSILMREESVLDKKIKSIYAKLYPGKALPENPKKSIEKELSQLESSRLDSKFMRLLKLVAPAAAPLMANSVLKTATFKNNQLILEVETKDTALIDQLRQALEKRGLKVVVSNAQRVTGGMIATRLTVEESS